MSLLLRALPPLLFFQTSSRWQSVEGIIVQVRQHNYSSSPTPRREARPAQMTPSDGRRPRTRPRRGHAESFWEKASSIWACASWAASMPRTRRCVCSVTRTRKTLVSRPSSIISPCSSAQQARWSMLLRCMGARAAASHGHRGGDGKLDRVLIKRRLISYLNRLKHD